MDVGEAAQRVPFMRAMNDDELRQILPQAQLKTLKRQEKAWADGQDAAEFTFVVRGRMKLVRVTPQGRHSILDVRSPGEALCTGAVCNFVPYCCSSVAMEEGTEVLSVPRRDVLELLENNSGLTRAFVREMTCRSMNMCGRVEELASGKVEQRVALLLVRLADRTGHAVPDKGTRVPIPLSRQDIADLCGTTLETAIRTMSRLKREDIVVKAARGFLIKDRAALEAIARGDEPSTEGH